MYDEDGYGAIKRVIERGDDVASVKPIATIVVNYPVGYKLVLWKIFFPICDCLRYTKVLNIAFSYMSFQGAYKGAYVSSELIATVLAILVFYTAYAAKSKLLA